MRDRIIYELARIVSDHLRVANTEALSTDPDTALYIAEGLGIKNQVVTEAMKLTKMYSD